MKTIELDKWEPSEEDPRKLKCAGQRTAQEVFEELKYRLDGMGYLPDEYFLLAQEWENGREIPQDADIFCTTDYGGSEGVYLDVYLKWYENWAIPARTLTGCFSSPPPSPRRSTGMAAPMPGICGWGNDRSQRT